MRSIALTVAGSDPSGGAGLQADLKTFHQHGVYGTAVVSLLTVQNTLGVRAVRVMDADFVDAQLGALFDDVVPLAAKTGALGSAEIVEVVASYMARRPLPWVVDPVMISKHGAPLLDKVAVKAMVERLVPHAALVTPNTPEAEALSGRSVRSLADARDAARQIADLGARAVLVKGGHLEGERATDVLFADGSLHELDAPRVRTRAGHGTGCTLSAAITARLARGETLVAAVEGAKRFLTRALATAPTLGQGVGPVDHFAPVDETVPHPPRPS